MPETVFSKDAPDGNQMRCCVAWTPLARLKVGKTTHTSMEWCALAVGRPGLTGAANGLEWQGAEALIESAVSCAAAPPQQRERLPRSSCTNGAELLIRSQLYQQTGGKDWAATQSDNLT